jgi:predicted SAM-dependent methyltransferase
MDNQITKFESIPISPDRTSVLRTVLENATSGKTGCEIGGPSTSGYEIYRGVSSIDNVIFSNNTVWSSHTDTYQVYEGKTGKVIINDAANISDIMSQTYDFIFASHVLEHIANPIRALKEWIRITKLGGTIILILPEKSVTFDHYRNVTDFSTLLQNFNNNVGEDDLSSLKEILEKHDLSMDPLAGNYEQFKSRSIDNFKNRCLHHHVYDSDLLKEICNYMKCEFIFTVTEGINIWFVFKTPSSL